MHHIKFSRSDLLLYSLFIVLFLPLWISDTAMDCVFLGRLISASHRLNVWKWPCNYTFHRIDFFLKKVFFRWQIRFEASKTRATRILFLTEGICRKHGVRLSSNTFLPLYKISVPFEASKVKGLRYYYWSHNRNSKNNVFIHSNYRQDYT